MAKQKKTKLTYKQMISYMEAMRVNLVQMQGTIERLNAVITNYVEFNKHDKTFLEWLKKRKEELHKTAEELSKHIGKFLVQ